MTDRWTGLELRHLTALQAIADTGSFKGAAGLLGYTPSAISQQIASLERIVGARVIAREHGRRAFGPTEAGKALLIHMTAIEARLGAAKADIDAFARGARGPPSRRSLRERREATASGGDAPFPRHVPGRRDRGRREPFESSYEQNWKTWTFSQQKSFLPSRPRAAQGAPSSRARGTATSSPARASASCRSATSRRPVTSSERSPSRIQRQLKSVGFELVPRFQPAGLLFGTTLVAGDWDLMWFGWNGNPSSSITGKDLYGCGGDQNYMNYGNGKLSKVLNEVSTTLDAAKRAQLLNAAEAKYMVQDVPSIPMFARPLFLISSTKLKGLVMNPTNEGSPWNISTWTTAE